MLDFSLSFSLLTHDSRIFAETLLPTGSKWSVTAIAYARVFLFLVAAHLAMATQNQKVPRTGFLVPGRLLPLRTSKITDRSSCRDLRTSACRPLWGMKFTISTNASLDSSSVVSLRACATTSETSAADIHRC